MSDLLSGLRKPDEPGNWPVGGPLTLAYNQALDDAREALLHPTDEQRALLGKALWDAGTRRPGEPEWEDLDLGLRRVYEKEACAVAAAAAGGDR